MSATKSTAAKRFNFGKVELIAEQPDLLGIQIQSFKDFFQLETTPDKPNRSKNRTISIILCSGFQFFRDQSFPSVSDQEFLQ